MPHHSISVNALTLESTMSIERIAYRKKMLMSRIRSGSGESSGVVKVKKKYKIRVMSNVAKPWWGREALTPNLWRE